MNVSTFSKHQKRIRATRKKQETATARSERARNIAFTAWIYSKRRPPHEYRLIQKLREEAVAIASQAQKNREKHDARFSATLNGLIQSRVLRGTEMAVKLSAYYQSHREVKEQVSTLQKSLIQTAPETQLLEKITLDFLHPQSRLLKDEKHKKQRKSSVITVDLASEVFNTSALKSVHGAALSIFFFVGLSASVLVPLKISEHYLTVKASQEMIQNTALSGVKHFLSGKEAIGFFDLAAANQEFIQASQQFQIAEQGMRSLPQPVSALAALFPGTRQDMKTVKAMFRIGGAVASSGRLLTAGLSVWTSSVSANNLVERLDQSSQNLSAALLQLREANEALEEMDPLLLSQHNLNIWRTLHDGLPLLQKNLDTMLVLNQMLSNILGKEEMKRYLILFQNNAELRATGGFMGSYALLDLSQGEIRNMEIPGGGFYDLSGGFIENITPPEPMLLFTDRWEVQDANWWPDFPTSAAHIMDFYQKGSGRSVDGVIAINANLMERLLSALGPVELPAYQKTLTEENFLLETQKAVEIEYDRSENQPKKIIADTAEILLPRILHADQKTWIALAEIMTEALAERDIQMFFTDEEVQQTIQTLGWAGVVTPTQPNDDFLMIVHTNIGGKKSDRVIHDTVSYTVSFDARARQWIATLRMERQHQGNKDELFYGANNVDFVRIYAPSGAKLLRADGFDTLAPDLFSQPPEWNTEDHTLHAFASTKMVDPVSGTVTGNEFGKTVFGNWIMTKPGSAKVVELSYILPISPGYFIQGHPYQLMIQKQSGANPMALNFSLIAPQHWGHLSGNNLSGRQTVDDASRTVRYSIPTFFLERDERIEVSFEETR